jgi:hypothetical protein
MLMSVQKPGCMDCVIPKKYKDPVTYEQTMEKYEYQL